MPTQMMLPEDIIADILLRLPVKSLLRFRCVCKPWCALISDPVFVKMQLSQSLASNGNLGLVFRSDSDLYSVDLDACEQQAMIKLDHPLKSSKYGIKVVGSCNGLLCITNPADMDIFLWNPSTRRHQKLPISPIIKSCTYAYISVYGFGYDPSTEDYKLVRFFKYSCFNSEVYSLSTNSWRKIGDMPYHFHIEYKFQYGVLANSVLHWVVSCETGLYPFSCFILSFNLQDEKYGEVPLPDFGGQMFHLKTRKFPTTIGVLRGQLCVFRNFFYALVEVWVMKDYGVKNSWVKQFTIDLRLVTGYQRYIKPLCYSKNDEVILERDAGVPILYDPHIGRARMLMICGAHDRLKAVVYVESLVALNAKDGTEQGERK